jgi:peptide subunit release factor 1 (eRF1)
MDEINKIIAEKKLKAADAEYHTIRVLENGGKIRALVVKGDNTLHIEYVCPNCQHSAYKKQPWIQVSKQARYRFSTKCDKCGFEMKVEKLKGGKKPKQKEE